MPYHKKKSGFTLMELIFTLAITLLFAVLSFSALYHLKSNMSYEHDVAERTINDAVVGYYSVLGTYPSDSTAGVEVKADEWKLTPEQITYIVGELRKYSGFVYVPTELLTQYDFYLYYPNDYVFKIRTEAKFKFYETGS